MRIGQAVRPSDVLDKRDEAVHVFAMRNAGTFTLIGAAKSPLPSDSGGTIPQKALTASLALVS